MSWVIQCWNEHVKRTVLGQTKHLRQMLQNSIWKQLREDTCDCDTEGYLSRIFFAPLLIIIQGLLTQDFLKPNVFFLNYLSLLSHAFIVHKVQWQWILTLLHAVWRSSSFYCVFWCGELGGGLCPTHFVSFCSLCITKRLSNHSCLSSYMILRGLSSLF